MSRLRQGLTKTRDFLNTDIEDLFSGKRQIDDELLEELEELLITADIGVQTTMDLMDKISRKASKIATPEDLKAILKEEIMAIVDSAPAAMTSDTPPRPKVIMIVGVNGVGKTTTIGKLASLYRREGKKVLIAASDTFRAAAIEQLSIWADRAGADIVRHKDQSDPAAVAFDAVEAAMARGMDIVLVDTAGRLHTKVNLMEELKKIKRSLSKKCADAPHETLLVLDATTGQNALSQAKLFDEAIDLNALALTKLDGTAKGGIVVSICSTLNIPLKVRWGRGADRRPAGFRPPAVCRRLVLMVSKGHGRLCGMSTSPHTAASDRKTLVPIGSRLAEFNSARQQTVRRYPCFC